ncbi:MAG: hypothetical protein C0412_14080 [Flavobacterium sp.]|nr:hypothetical protein [Flavobacterium sp.]
MNKEFLINKVAKLLGVSSSEKDFAFQIFLDKTAEVLEENEALKYSGLGFFYLKVNQKDKSDYTESLSFVPFQKDSHLMDENFFLNFDVVKKKKNSMEFDPSVFSLSIDKATLPFENSSGRTSDISYQLLKKTIEERVEDVISGAVHLRNFKITDTIFIENEEKEEFVNEDENILYEIKDENSYEEMVFSRMNFDESDDIIPGTETNKEFDTDSPKVDDEIFEKIVDDENIHTTFFKEETLNEELPDEGLIENGIPSLDDYIETKVIEKPKFDFFEKKEEGDNTGWTWPEKLIDDENSGVEDLIVDEPPEKPEVSDFVESPVEPENISSKRAVDDPFAELEKSFDIDDEIVEIMEEEVSNIEENFNSNIADEVSNNLKEEQMDEKKENTPNEEENPFETEDSNTKRNLLVGGLILVGLVAVYIIFFHGFGIIKKNPIPQTTANTNQTQPAENKDSLQAVDNQTKTPVDSKVNEIPKAADKSQKIKEERAGDILREIKNESKVAGNVYKDGAQYYVQVSSWKNVTKAEQEAKKLKTKGLDAFVVKAYIEQFKGTWYRVRVGGFKTKEEAEAFEMKNK